MSTRTDITVRELIAEAGLAVSEARILLMHVLGVSRTWLIAHDTDAVDAGAVARFRVLAQRRIAGEPIAYLVGWREFMGHVFKVSPAVLIPRPETELLVETGLASLAGIERPRILDLGTGSGAIGISLALARPDAEVIATDASGSALAVARSNAAALGAKVFFRQGDWWAALTEQDRGTRFDLIVSNPPYIASRDEHLAQGDLRFEPPGALTDYADGLAALRAIAQQASSFLRPGAGIWLEHGYDQAQAVRNLLANAGLQGAHSHRDLAGIERITGAFYNPSISSLH